MSRVCIYNGEGSSSSVVHMMKTTLTKLLKNHVCLISPEEIVNSEWEKDTAVLVVGGGYDLGFIKALGPDGISRIRQYVHEGGGYLGCCAGAYFACDSIQFDKDGHQHVCGSRDLKFFPGVGIGPLFKEYMYDSHEGSHAAELQLTAESGASPLKFHVYFNGGCQFVFPDRSQAATTKVIARYTELEGRPAAAVLCYPGKGLAVLTGVHPEMSASLLPHDDVHIKTILPKLQESESAVNEFLKLILKRFNLSVDG